MEVSVSPFFRTFPFPSFFWLFSLVMISVLFFLDSLYRFRVQMIAMLVGDQDDIGFRESRIIGVFGDRIYLYRMIVVRKHQAAMLDERDGQFFFPLLVLKESEAKLLAEAKLAMNKLHISIHVFSLIILRFFKCFRKYNHNRLIP